MRFPSCVAFFLVLLLFSLVSVQSRAADVVVLESAPLKVYEEAKNAFLAELVGDSSATGPKQIITVQSESFYLSDYEDVEAAQNDIRRSNSRLIFALGQQALDASLKLEDTAILFVLADKPSLPKPRQPTVAGITLGISPSRQLELLLSRFSFKRPGILCSGGISADLLEKARKAARQRGLELMIRQIDHAKETAEVAKEIADKIDALWLFPDTSVLTPSTLEYLAFFSLENRIPIFGFSEKLLQYGSAAVTVFDVADIGRQAAEMARRILEGTAPGRVGIQEPRKIALKINRAVLDNLGFPGYITSERTLNEGQ
jgi:putative ABC transport system substrate-binding protein